MASSAEPRNPWWWTVLTLLHERDMHPYEMQQCVIHRHKDFLVEHKPGSLYSVIGALHNAGLIAPRGTTRSGKLPPRTVYRLTDAGRQALLDWLRRRLSSAGDRDFPRVAFAVEKLMHLPASEVRELLTLRIAELADQIDRLNAVFVANDESDSMGSVQLLEIDYARTVRQAEMEWTRSLIERLDDGRLTWDVITAQQQRKRADASG